MGNAEVPQHRVASPPADALEAVCQLLGLPFRHEKGAGVFAVYPPLLGRRIIIRSFAVDREARGSLHEQLASELRLLERLLWVSGADVTLLESQQTSAESFDRTGESAYWDLTLFVYPSHAVPGCIKPLVIYSWWHSPLKSRRLAGCIERAEKAADSGMQRATTMRMAKELKNWYYRALSQTRAPAVLLSVPLVDGYGQSFLDRLSLRICDGVLRFFRKPPLSPETASILRQKILMPELPLEREPLVVMPDSPQETDTDKPEEAIPQVVRTPDPHCKTQLGPQVNQKSRLPSETQSVEPPSLLEEREAAIIVAQQARARQARPTIASADGTGVAGPRNALTQRQYSDSQKLYGYSGNILSLSRPAQVAQQDNAEEMEELRRLLVEAPEIAKKRAEEILVKKRIKPTKGLVDEYVEYLKRMLLKTESNDEGRA